MTTRSPVSLLALSGALSTALLLAACSSDGEKPSNAAAGTGNAAGQSQGSGGQGQGGGAGKLGSGGAAGSGQGAAGAGAGGGSAGNATGGGAGTTSGSAGAAATAGMAAGAGGGAGAGAGAGSGGAPGGGMGGTAPLGMATFTVDVKLASEMDAKAPTTVGIVSWSVDVAALTEAHIDFGLDTSYGMRAPVDVAKSPYRTLLLGMKPGDKTYHFKVVATDGTKSYESMDYTVKTGAATTKVPFGSFSVKDEAKRERGFIITSYWQGTGSGVTYILDPDGEIVWWYEDGPTSIARARMSADGQNMWMTSADNNGAPLQRVSMDTLDAQTYQNVVTSHDLTPVSGATMAYLEYGENDCNSIFEIDPSGTTKEVFESQDVVAASGCHGNAVRYSKAEDLYTYSDVSQDVFAVNRMGQLQWKLSEKVSMGNDAWGGVQHGHQLLDNSILIFANRGGGMNASAAIEYDLTSGAELLNFTSGDFSQNLGDVQRLPKGNTLVTFSNDSIIKEIDPQKNVVLEIDGGGSRLGYALWTESLYAPAPDILQ